MSSFLGIFSRMLSLGRHQMPVSSRNVILITGCDSGLGFSLALYCHSLNLTVISACHNIKSEGARLLQNVEDPQRMITIELDLLKQDTISKAQEVVSELLEKNKNYQFTALVNNAGVMCFGEFEWQTRNQFEMQINVNLLGTMRLTKEMLPVIRRYRARIINVTSHCGLQALPSLGPYAASKAALRFWTDALRIEMQAYGVEVINFIPGSFVMESNISARQQELARDMYQEFSEEQKSFYGPYFKRFNEYLKLVSGFKPPNGLKNETLLEKFKDALTSNLPYAMYIQEPWRYKFYRFLFKICPTTIVDWLAVKFCAMPTYKQVTDIPDNNRNITECHHLK